MKNHCMILSLITTITFSIPLSSYIMDDDQTETEKTKAETLTDVLPAVEDNFVVMMSLVFAPAFERLQAEIGRDSNVNEVNFTEVQRQSLILTEFTARLHQWPEIAKFKSDESKTHYEKEKHELGIEEVHKHAAAIYSAARKKEFAPAQKSFVAMTRNCNICHKKRKSRWVPLILEP